jgi:LysM repeat protein
MTALGSRTAATGEAGTPIATSTVTVYPGDTLWDIAATIAEPGEVKKMIYLIQDLNGMDSSELVAGQKLVVPTR